MSKLIDAIYKINFVISHKCIDKTETILNKQMVQNSYSYFSQLNNSCYARSILSCHIFKLLPSNLVRSKNQFVLNSKVI
ncbi:hypothetical protein [Legionella sp. km772]|uniref:hypothetical protein n=1 Tax=Legionella sp. km772 TaxID=2498111 RepID=UPI00131566CF|nr:hypothetical protein [Legionella sp. km772]